mmetsp:Transcript_6101/g.7488  ORF Transcript_6101/g.7488 Transcript_6101/m.7488 type:complete len:629 (-) Transcript_6101:76-1962(-)
MEEQPETETSASSIPSQARSSSRTIARTQQQQQSTSQPIPPAPPSSSQFQQQQVQGQHLKESPAAAMLRLSPDRWILQPTNYGNGSMHVTVPPTARRGRGDSSGATRAADGIPLMLSSSGLVGSDASVSMNDSHMNDNNTKSCRVYSFPAQLLDIIEDEDSLDADAPPPPHSSLVNFPAGSASERRARVNPSNPNRSSKKNLNGKNGNPNQQHCVMCGRGTESDNVVIPVQNKQVCTDCDTGVWLFKGDNTYFKWCKGCKRFRSIHAFREKLQGLRGATRTTCLPSKCDSCRCRGRLGYRAKKEAVLSTFRGGESEEGSDSQSTNGAGAGGQGTGASRSASLDALLLTGLANPSSNGSGSGSNLGDGGDGDGGEELNDEDSGEGPNKKQKRSLKPVKSSNKDISKPNRGRKGKNPMGMQLPLGLSMPMGMPNDLPMSMQMGLPLGMMPGGLPMSFHHAMYMQQQANNSNSTTGNSSNGGPTVAVPSGGTVTNPQTEGGGEGSRPGASGGGGGGGANATVPPSLLYNSPFSQQLVECLMKMPMYSGTGGNNGAPPPLHSAESVTVAAATAAATAVQQQVNQQQQQPMDNIQQMEENHNVNQSQSQEQAIEAQSNEEAQMERKPDLSVGV